MSNTFTASLVEIKKGSVTDDGTFTGYASTWDGQPDTYNDIIKRGAFTDALSYHKRNGTLPAMLWSHDQTEPIGKWISVTEDAHGLLVVGKLTLGTKRGAEAHALLKDAAISLSIGFTVAPGGASNKAGVREITKVGKLLEISLVAIPANHNAKVTNVKKPENVREFEKSLRDVMNFSAREAKRIASGGFRNIDRDDQKTDLAQVLARIEELRSEIIESKSL